MTKKISLTTSASLYLKVLATFAFVMIGLSPVNASEELSEEINGVTYYYDVNSYYKSARLITGTEPYTGNLVVPSELGGFPVTDISIARCNSLVSIAIPNSVTVISAIFECPLLGELVIPNTVVRINPQAFYGNASLEHVKWPTGLKSLPTSVFYMCGKLREIELPSGLEEIGEHAFYDCTSLDAIDIPESVVSIGEGAFADCRSLSSLRIPKNVSTIGGVLTPRCYNITNIIVDAENEYFRVVNGCLVSCAGKSVFAIPSAFKSLTIPDGVIDIPSGLFQYNNNVETISFPESLNTISDFAFEYCSSLKQLHLPASVALVKQGAFMGCGCEKIFFNGDAPVVPSPLYNPIFSSGSSCVVYAYSDTEGWPSDGYWQGKKLIILDRNAPKITLDAAGGSLSEEHQLLSIAAGCEIGELPIPARKSYTFDGWWTDIEGGERITPTTIVTGDATYYAHWAIATETLTIENGLLVEADVNGAKAIVIPDGVTAISGKAFLNGGNLTSIYIPDTVASIPPTTFDGCDKLWAKWFKTLERLSDVNATVPNSVSLTVTNVVVHYVMTAPQSAAITPIGDTGIVNIIAEVRADNKPVAISSVWAEQYGENFTAKFGTDFSKAITAMTGKKDCAGNAMYVWQDFVAGTDPTDENDIFKASITVDSEGKPHIAYSPTFLHDSEAAMRKYTIFGKVKLTDEWSEVAFGDEGEYNFFKVTVEMR